MKVIILNKEDWQLPEERGRAQGSGFGSGIDGFYIANGSGVSSEFITGRGQGCGNHHFNNGSHGMGFGNARGHGEGNGLGWE
jgi:hypothetical protein